MTKLVLFTGLLMFIGLGCNLDQKSDNKMSQTESEKKTGKKEKNDEKKDEKKDKDADKTGKKGNDEKKDAVNNDVSYSENVAILGTWEMPTMLKEISGICWFENNKIAAVQDESGIIFIYDLVSKKIEKEIPFGAKGDYEGIAVTPKAFYVLRADGTVIEVPKSKGQVKEHDTHLSVKDDTEGICYDAKTQQLLISLKATSGTAKSNKHIYSFNIATKKLSAEPVFSIDTRDQIFETATNSKPKDSFHPSEISIHPKTGEMYLTGGANSSLLVLNNTAKANYYTLLNPADFNQPEGIAFSPEGELYIATEGVKDPGKIFKINLINKP